MQNNSIYDMIDRVDRFEIDKKDILILLVLNSAFDSKESKLLLDEMEKDKEIKNLCSYYIIKKKMAILPQQ